MTDDCYGMCGRWGRKRCRIPRPSPLSVMSIDLLDVPRPPVDDYDEVPWCGDYQCLPGISHRWEVEHSLSKQETDAEKKAGWQQLADLYRQQDAHIQDFQIVKDDIVKTYRFGPAFTDSRVPAIEEIEDPNERLIVRMRQECTPERDAEAQAAARSIFWRDMVWRPYIAAGAPYGETDEGARQWADERKALMVQDDEPLFPEFRPKIHVAIGLPGVDIVLDGVGYKLVGKP